MSSIIYPLSTEKSIRMMETGNVLTFIVNKDSKKSEIKKDLEEMFKVRITKITTNIMADGSKKAYVKISPETPAIDIATKLGMV